MSKTIYLCFKNKELEEKLTSGKSFETLSERLTPENIRSSPPRIIKKNGIVAAIINPVRDSKLKNQSIFLGTLVSPSDEWHVPLSGVPDGNYAGFRGDAYTVEVLTDVVASRTIWYYHDSELFIASTSQRAIVFFLRSFSLNRNVIPWMLSSGRLGYNNSWDTRIKKMKGDSRLVLNRKTWTINIIENPVIFEPHNIDLDSQVKRLEGIYLDAFEGYDFDPNEWLLTLSGGHDSRLILMLLKNKKNLKCISWGRKESINDKQNDAYIARQLANYYNCEHLLFDIDIKVDLIENSLQRLLVSGEGRVDSITAYMDGMNTWKNIFEMNVSGIIRGDMGYNVRAVVNEEQVRKSNGIELMTDYSGSRTLERFGFPSQEIHTDLKKRRDESLTAYNHRLYHIYQLPHVYAALSDIKAAYIEVSNPLITKSIFAEIRRIPDKLLYYKKAHRTLIESLSPDIEFAVRTAPEDPRSILYHPRMVEFLKTKLTNDMDFNVLPRDFINLVTNNLHVFNKNNTMRSKLSMHGIKRSIRAMISKKNKQKLNAYIKKQLEYNSLALRSYIITETSKLLREDASALKVKNKD